MRDRQAARLAALIALPVAVLAGLVIFRVLAHAEGAGGDQARPSASPAPAATGAVSMPDRSLSPDATLTCRGLIANLPGNLRGLGRRPVTAGAEQNAAYGDPPITVSCGGPVPSLAPDAWLALVGPPCWYADESRPDATVWYTVDRRVPVTINFPAAYRSQGEGDWVQEFRDTILNWVPSLANPPTGCAAPSIAPS